MEEIMLREYLDSRSKGMTDHEFMDKMRRFFSNDNYNRGMRESNWDNDYSRINYNGTNYNKMSYGGYINRHSDSQLSEMLEGLNHEDKQRLMEMMYSKDSYNKMNYMHDEDISEQEAKYIVSQMYHTSNDKKYIGEKYDMHKAKEVLTKYGSSLGRVNPVDIYIAINAQYHDYCDLYKSWFGSNIDHKIIESAITFWFKDVDCQGGNKVYKYFKNI